jgi:hypothetical protein
MMVLKVAASAVCPLCGAKMREGQVELLSHHEQNLEIICSTPYMFNFIE